MFIHVMVNGLPGRMATEVAKAVANDERMQLVKYSLTGEEVTEDKIDIGGAEITLIRPSERKNYEFLFYETFQSMAEWKPLVIVDLTVPMAVNDNVKFYTRHGFNFVIGTTGGDKEEMETDIKCSKSIAVVDKNMSIPIVILKEMWRYAAERFPGALKNFSFEGWESHQRGKKDPSGTMKEFFPIFVQLGIPASERDMDYIREPVDQIPAGIPEEFLGAHGWHDYNLSSEKDNVEIFFGHNVNGRNTYVEGFIAAIVFLHRKSFGTAVKGKIFSMVDVISK